MIDKSFDSDVWDKPMAVNRALIIFFHGRGITLTHSADDGTESHIEYLSANNASGGGSFDIDDQVEFTYPGDGLFIADLEVVEDGPGDCPGAVECVLRLANIRPATAAEWIAHCEGNWAWDPYTKEVKSDDK